MFYWLRFLDEFGTCGLIDGAGLDVLVSGSDKHGVEDFGPEDGKTADDDDQH